MDVDSYVDVTSRNHLDLNYNKYIKFYFNYYGSQLNRVWHRECKLDVDRHTISDHVTVQWEYNADIKS